MNIEETEIYLQRLNEKIIKTNNRIKHLPFNWLRDYAFTKLMKVIDHRNEMFRNLRDKTRKKHPERFIGYDYPKDNQIGVSKK